MSSDIFHNMKLLWKRWRDATRQILRRKKGTKETGSKNLAMHQVLTARHAGVMPSASQLKYLPRLLNTTEKRIGIVAILIILFTGTFLAGRLINAHRAIGPAVGGEYTEGLVGIPQLINPIYASTSDVDSDLSKLIFNGLMRYDTIDGLVLDIADSYEISDDSLVYTFKLRKDAYWHDGEPVRAEDVLFTMSAIQNPEYRSPLEVSFSGIKVDQIDEYTVQFTLNETFAPFLSLLTVGILPSHIWQDVAPLNALVTEYNKKPIGSGPYKFEKLLKDAKGNIRSYTLERNANYHLGAPYIDRLHFKFYPETTSAVEALRNHNIEGIGYLPLESVEDFQRDNSVKLLFPSLGQYVAAFFNQNHNDILKEDLVREALALGINKEGIVENVLNNQGATIKSFILPGMIGEYPDINIQVYDPPSAREKLEKAKWVLEEGSTIRKKDDKELALEIVTVNTKELVSVANELALQFAEIGVKINIRTVDSATFQSDTLKNRNYDILLSGELYGIDPDPYAFWHSSQTNYPGLNLAGFSNRKADEYIETARKIGDPDKRSEALRSLQDLVAEEISALFLYQPSYSFAVSSKIHNVDVQNIVNPSDRFSRVQTWYIKTRREVQ